MSVFTAENAFVRLLTLIVFLPVIALAQAPQRVVEKLSWRSEPIKIQKVRTNGTTIELGKRFPQEKNWLKGLTLSVQNVSNQAIARIEINLAFPRPPNTADDIPTYVVRLMYGLDPSDGYSETQRPVLPGDSVDVVLPEVNLPLMKEDLASLGYPQEITHARLTVNLVTFMDGSTWAGDQTLYPDPNNPNKKINPRLQTEPPTPTAFPYFRLENAIFNNVQPIFAPARKLVSRPLTVQDPALACNTVFVTTQTHECGTAGSGCTFKQNIFDGNIELLGLRNARSQLSSTRCQQSDGTFCTSTLISNFDRLPCGALIAGTCFAIADWITYPTTGCITGLIFGGPCTRSNQFQSRCADPTGYDQESCSCPDGINTSPIVVDVDNSGFSMTDARSGTVFDILNDHVPLQLSWTAPMSTNAFLVLDRNGNGKVDNGEELFGNVTPQPLSSEPNGFLALAEFDKPGNGGNGNGSIEKHDSIYTQLRLWRDVNHNGISEPEELRPLSGLIRAIDLDYKEARRTDRYGNQFRYRAKVYDLSGKQGGRWAWDVYFVAP